MRFNAKGPEEDTVNNLHLSSYMFNESNDFHANRLIVIDTIKVDEHSRLTLTKKVKNVFPVFSGDTIVVYQDRYTKDLLFKVQRQKNIVDGWIIRRNSAGRSTSSVIAKTGSNRHINSKNTVNNSVLAANQAPWDMVNTKYKNESENKNANILLVDDEEDLLEAFKFFLKSAGYYNFNTFADSRKAVKHIADLKNPSHYHLAILDIRMRDINGIQLYQILKVIDPQIKVLFISALDAAEELTSIIPGIKGKDIIRKPVEPEDFTKRVNELLLSVS